MPYDSRNDELELVPDLQVVIPGARDVGQMEAEHLRRGTFIC